MTRKHASEALRATETNGSADYGLDVGPYVQRASEGAVARRPYHRDAGMTLYLGDVLDVLRELPDESVQCVITSPPYWNLRDYGTATWVGGDADCDHILDRSGGGKSSTLGGGKETQTRASIYRDCQKCGAQRIDKQLGLEPTPDAYVANMVAVFREVRRVLRADGTCWLNLGSSYVSGGTGSSRTRQPARVPAYGSDGIEPQGSQVPGSAYHGLCDECLADYLTHHGRIVHTDQHLEQSGPHESQTIHDNGRSDSAEASPDASLLDVQESTTLESWRRLRGECSRCDSRAVSLSSLRSSSGDVRLFARMAENTNGTRLPADSWDSRTSDTELFSTASVNPPKVQPQYTSFKPKDMVPIPWMVAMALQADGWYLRSDIIWSKPNPMPESVTDRPTKSHEYLFLLTKSSRYAYDADAIREPHQERQWMMWDDRKAAGEFDDNRHEITLDSGQYRFKHGAGFKPGEGGRNKRSVWTVATHALKEAHFATFPPKLIEPCILAGSREGDVVLDPFLGSGTTALVAQKHGRRCIGIDISADYLDLAIRRNAQKTLWFAEEAS